MIKLLPIFALLISSAGLANTKVDPNNKKMANKSTVVAPGCTEFIHPCSGQASTALLNVNTLPITTKAALPTVTPPIKKGNQAK